MEGNRIDAWAVEVLERIDDLRTQLGNRIDGWHQALQTHLDGNLDRGTRDLHTQGEAHREQLRQDLQEILDTATKTVEQATEKLDRLIRVRGKLEDAAGRRNRILSAMFQVLPIWTLLLLLWGLVRILFP